MRECFAAAAPRNDDLLKRPERRPAGGFLFLNHVLLQGQQGAVVGLEIEALTNQILRLFVFLRLHARRGEVQIGFGEAARGAAGAGIAEGLLARRP